jgi:hypothetical protein
MAPLQAPDRLEAAAAQVLRPRLEDRPQGAVFTGAASVRVTRYRYRGSTIPTPWTPTPAATIG